MLVLPRAFEDPGEGKNGIKDVEDDGEGYPMKSDGGVGDWWTLLLQIIGLFGVGLALFELVV